jgi:hypothetical protein
MRRSFRVATAFTGVAAATAFTPAANAAVTHAVKPAIVEENCNSGTRQWIHLYYPASAHHGPICFAHPGTYPLGGNLFTSVCAGNNYGAVFGHYPGHTGRSVFRSFGPGGTVIVDFDVSLVSQSRGVTGTTYTCPQ